MHVPVSLKEHPHTPTFLDLRSGRRGPPEARVPRLAGKTELVPNKINTMWIDPERTGLYLEQMRQILRDPTFVDACCGSMLTLLKNLTVGWSNKKHRRQATRRPAAGRRIFERNACINCHAINGTVGTGRFGPDLTHLMSRDTLGSGVVKNTPENLRAWIKAPDQFKPGVLMPAMNLNMTRR